MAYTQKPIIVEQVFNLQKEKIWDAITQLSQMKKWFFGNIPSFEPRIGFYTEFDILSGGRSFRHQWKIVEVIPFQRIKYHWSYKEYPGVGFVTFDLIETENKTVLRLTNNGLDSFPQDIPEFSPSSCENGWSYFIKKNLVEFLSGLENSSL